MDNVVGGKHDKAEVCLNDVFYTCTGDVSSKHFKKCLMAGDYADNGCNHYQIFAGLISPVYHSCVCCNYRHIVGSRG